MTDLNQQLRKYFIMGSQNCNRDPVEILKEAIVGGITAFQYREKGTGSLSGKAKLELGRKLRDICHKNDVLFFINDDVDLVETLDADGIHVGQDDMPIEQIRERFPDKIIGLSISNMEEVKPSPMKLVDYVGAGPIFTTSTKEDAISSVGLEWIKTLKDKFPLLPVVGIGGINPENARSVIQAGADGVSVISAITKAKNIKGAVKQL